VRFKVLPAVLLSDSGLLGCDAVSRVCCPDISKDGFSENLFTVLYMCNKKCGAVNVFFSKMNNSNSAATRTTVNLMFIGPYIIFIVE
jgi:hypothetical protein